jgi:hypothetical protein
MAIPSARTTAKRGPPIREKAGEAKMMAELVASGDSGEFECTDAFTSTV